MRACAKGVPLNGRRDGDAAGVVSCQKNVVDSIRMWDTVNDNALIAGIQLLKMKTLNFFRCGIVVALMCLSVFTPLYSQLPVIRPSDKVPEVKPLRPEWVQNDIDGVRYLIGLFPIEKNTVASLRKQFENRPDKTWNSWTDEGSRGFGMKRVVLNLGLGYTSVNVDLMVFDDEIAHYKMAAHVGAREWPNHRNKIAEVWKESGGPPFKLDDNDIVYEKYISDVWAEYYAAISRELGPMKIVKVPDDLLDAYQLLTNPFENSSISMVACSEGKPAIDALEDAKRVDLIENVLRGYNPGGRIYAAISLLRMERKGRKLSRSTKAAITKVVNLDATVSTCWGDVGTSGLRAMDVVPRFVRSKDWYLLRKP